MNLHVPRRPHVDRDLLGMLADEGAILILIGVAALILCVSSCDTTLVTG